MHYEMFTISGSIAFIISRGWLYPRPWKLWFCTRS